MTCASCVRRVEKALGQIDGVATASVNLANERARVILVPGASVTSATLTAAVEKAGYNAHTFALTVPAEVESSAGPEVEEEERRRTRDRNLADLKRKSLVSLATGVVMMLSMYVPLSISERTLAPILLLAATNIQVWAGRVFYEQTWLAAKHHTTNMNTLVAVGTSVAFGYSAFVTLWPQLADRWGLPYHLSTTSQR